MSFTSNESRETRNDKVHETVRTTVRMRGSRRTPRRLHQSRAWNRIAYLERTALAVVLALLLCTAASAGRNHGRTLVAVDLETRDQLEELARSMDLDEATRDLRAVIWATESDLKRLDALGLPWHEASEPQKSRVISMCVDPDGPPFEPPASWDCYPTWEQYVDLMNFYADNFPEICELVDLGPSGTGDHSLLALKISDHLTTEEDEPEFLYTSSMHGDELAGYGMTLQLIHELLTGYGSDQELTDLVDDLVIWINPLANPDGTFAGGDHTVSGSQRYYVTTSTDPNRSFPDPESGDDPSSGGWAPETQLMIDLAEAESFTMAANFHGGAEVVNYPWDLTYTRHADDTWYQLVSREYADNAQDASPSGYLTDQNNGITNGADWYVVNGGRQDFMNYYHGCREVTIEVSGVKLIGSDELVDHWNWNRQAMLDFMKQARYGIAGVVTNADTGDPVPATIKVIGLDDETLRTWAYTDPDVGDFHRPIEEGTWDIEISAPGYETAVVEQVPATDGAVTRADVDLTPLPSRPIGGVVTDEATLAPIQGAILTLEDSGFPPVESAADGSYSISGVWDGTYDLRVEADGYGAWLESIQVSDQSTVFDVELKPYTVVLDNDFETGDGDFEASAGWQWGTDLVAGAASGTKVWGTVLGADYGANNVDWSLDTPPLQIPADADSAELVFSHWYSIENTWDGGHVRVSTDGGPFVLVTPVQGYPDDDVEGLDDEPGFTGEQTTWSAVRIDLSSFIGHDVVIRWRFGTDSSQTSYRGWYLDDVSVRFTGGTPPAPEVFIDDFELGDPSRWSGSAGLDLGCR